MKIKNNQNLCKKKWKKSQDLMSICPNKWAFVHVFLHAKCKIIHLIYSSFCIFWNNIYLFHIKNGMSESSYPYCIWVCSGCMTLWSRVSNCVTSQMDYPASILVNSLPNYDDKHAWGFLWCINESKYKKDKILILFKKKITSVL